jgi:hypothetical protein
VSINLELKKIVYRIKPWNSLALVCDDFCIRAGEKYYFMSHRRDLTARAFVSLCAAQIKPDQGQVLYDGKTLKALSPVMRRRMVSIDCRTSLDSWLTVSEYLHICARLSGRQEESISLDIQKFLAQNRKGELSRRPIGTLGRMDNLMTRFFAAGLFLPSLICADLTAMALNAEEEIRALSVLEAVSGRATLIACLDSGFSGTKYFGGGRFLHACDGRVTE